MSTIPEHIFTDYHLPAHLSLRVCYSLQYILNELEVKAKTELWMKQNEEYLREQKGKRTREKNSFINMSLYTPCVLMSGVCGPVRD